MEKEIIWGIRTVNNHTDKEYFFSSSNDFGLEFCYVNQVIEIEQIINKEQEKVHKAVLYNHSIIEITVK